MIEITKENLNELYDKNKIVFQNWVILNDKIKSFMNNSKPNTFDIVFKDQSKRLWIHFRNDCNNNFQEFLTYLNREQTNSLLMNIQINDLELYI